MTDLSKNIVDAFEQLRSFCRELSLLLTTADSLMNKAGWEPKASSTITAENSAGISYPDRWLPSCFFRYYKHTEMSHVLAFISVIVADSDRKVAVPQAIITGGWVDYGEGNPIPSGWSFWFARWHLWMPDGNTEGRLCSSDPREEWNHTPPEGIQTASTFGYLLEEITGPADLEEKIVQRLASEIQKACGDEEAHGTTGE